MVLRFVCGAVWVVLGVGNLFVFVFRQQSAYGRRISDWSSDVCSSDLMRRQGKSAQTAIGSGRTSLNRELLSYLGGARRGVERPERGNGAEVTRFRDRSEERRGGNECVSTCRSRWAQDH